MKTGTFTPRAIFFFCLLFISASLQAQDFLMQGWYWDYPKPANPNGNPNTEPTWAKTLTGQVPNLASDGFTYLWLPPLSRASFGSNSNGYDPKDLYDLGEYGLGATGFGFRQDVDALIAACNNNSLEAVADVVYNHRDGGLPEPNQPVKDYVTSHFSYPGKNPYPSDRFRIKLPIGGATGNGAGDYFIKISSKTGHPDFYNKPYKLYLETGVVGFQGLPAGSESEPNGGGGCGEPNNTVQLGRDYNANVDGLGCNTDEFKITLSASDFNASGDYLYIYISNVNGQYSDHRPYEIYYNTQQIAGQLIYETYTDFTSLPSGQGSMNFEAFRPRTGTAHTETLNPEWNSMLFFYDYDQSSGNADTGLRDWTTWLWNNAGIRGYRADAVKHFNPAFFGDLLDHIYSQGIAPGMVVGEYFDTSPTVLKNWVTAVQNAMNASTKSAIDVRVFDFALREALKKACDQFGYDVRNLYNSGIVEGVNGNPFNVVTFINNHDYRDPGQPVQNNPELAYAYILTNNQIGLPCVFYPDYFGVPIPNAPLTDLEDEIEKLITLHQQYIYQSPSVDYLNRFGSPYFSQINSGAPNAIVLFQLTGPASTGKDVIVCINFAGIPLNLTHGINMANVPANSAFTRMLGNATGPLVSNVDNNGRLNFQLPAFSYDVWVEGVLTPLPAELVQFTAEALENYVELRWDTENEVNLKGFEIERSIDGENFSSLGFVEALAREGEGASYVFPDKEVWEGLYYYRLKIIDQDGSFEYSDLRTARFNREISEIVLVPNPTNGSATLMFDAHLNNLAHLRVYDTHGRKLSDRWESITDGPNQLEIDLSDQPDGVYLVRLITPGGASYGAKLVKSVR